LELLEAHAVGCAGLQLTLRRLREDLQVARAEALEELR